LRLFLHPMQRIPIGNQRGEPKISFFFFFLSLISWTIVFTLIYRLFPSVTIKRVNKASPGDIRSTIQQTVDRFESTGKYSWPLSRIERQRHPQQQQQQQRLEVGDGGDISRHRSKKIDAERVPVQINALETAV